MPVATHGPAVIYKPITALLPNPKNARRHSKRQLKLLADSISAFGFVNPVLVDDRDMILAGHGRVQAAKALGLHEAPTLSITGLSDEQKRAYVLADNKLAEAAGWDRGMLASELGDLAVLLPKLALDWTVEITGFTTGEIDALVHDHSESSCAPEDDLPQAKPATVSCRGDLWQLGSNRILCGDARSRDDVRRLMGDERARVVLTDPPYNVAIQGHVTRREGSPHAEFAMASGEMDEEAFEAFLEAALSNAVSVSLPGSVHFVFMDWLRIPLIVGAHST